MKLKYIDKRERFFPQLAKYFHGTTVKCGDIIETTEKEGKGLLTMKNGNLFSWEKFEPKKNEKPDLVIKEESIE